MSISHLIFIWMSGISGKARKISEFLLRHFRCPAILLTMNYRKSLLLEWLSNIIDKENKENMSKINAYFTEFAGVCFSFYLYLEGKNGHLLQF